MGVINQLKTGGPRLNVIACYSHKIGNLMVNIDVSTMIKIEHQISGYINGISNTPLVVEDFLERLASLKDRPHICNWFVMFFLHVIIHLRFLDIPGVHPKGRGAVAAVVHQLQGTHCFCDFTISMPRHPASNQV